MEIEKPYLFTEINDNFFNFLVVEYNEELDFKIIYSKSVKSEGVSLGKIFNLETCFEIIQKNINQIEKEVNFIFNKVTVISDIFNLECLNISSGKKLNGAQVTEDDISYILNNIKKLVVDNEPNKSILHLFNSNFVIDDVISKKIPIGLFGEFYNQHLTFYLLSKTDLKNFKSIFNRCKINIERIFLKNFVEGINLINKEKINSKFALINIYGKKSNISFFDNLSPIYSENFKFGSDIIIQDISKICSFSFNTAKKIIFENNFDQIDKNLNKKYLPEKYFDETKFRKISFSHIKNIIDARIEEITDLIYENNINLKEIKNKNDLVYIYFQDEGIFKNLVLSFKKNFSNLENFKSFKQTKDELMNACISSAELLGKGWEKEAIPITQSKKSIISRIFSSFFK